MTWQDEAECQGEDPRQWDETGSAFAVYLCTQVCPVRTQCVEAAIKEGPTGQMRGGIWFDDKGILRHPRHLRRVA